MDPINISKQARDLSRNPLGIIALFIVLVYGIAALFFGLSASKLENPEKILIVLFLISFPFVVLFVFYRLVTKHHTKLYAPKDFFESGDFFRAMSPFEQAQKLEDEVANANDSNFDTKEKQIPPGNPDLLTRLSQPENTLLRSDYLLAEELALREIESEFKSTIRRNVALGSDNYGFDGVLCENNKYLFIEIKIIRRIKTRLLTDILKETIARVRKNNVPSSLLICFVTIGGETRIPQQQLDNLAQFALSINVEVVFRVFCLEDLIKKYGAANNQI
jgi:hypothetical protein